MSVTDVINEREKTHGNFDNSSRCSQALKQILQDEISRRHQRGQPKLSDGQLEAVSMICHKLGRVMSGDADLSDHWDDIAGYALLAKGVRGVVETRDGRPGRRIARVPRRIHGSMKPVRLSKDGSRAIDRYGKRDRRTVDRRAPGPLDRRKVDGTRPYRRSSIGFAIDRIGKLDRRKH